MRQEEEDEEEGGSEECVKRDGTGKWIVSPCNYLLILRPCGRDNFQTTFLRLECLGVHGLQYECQGIQCQRSDGRSQTQVHASLVLHMVDDYSSRNSPDLHSRHPLKLMGANLIEFQPRVCDASLEGPQPWDVSQN